MISRRERGKLRRGEIELEDLFRPPPSIVNAAGVGVELFGERIERDHRGYEGGIFVNKTAYEGSE